MCGLILSESLFKVHMIIPNINVKMSSELAAIGIRTAEMSDLCGLWGLPTVTSPDAKTQMSSRFQVLLLADDS